jgi:hypothetical protein
MLEATTKVSSTEKPSYQSGMQIMKSPVGTINTGTESCSVVKEGVLVNMAHGIIFCAVTK